MRIALAQIQSGTEPAANLQLVEDYTRRAADAGASLVLFPEATMCRFGVPLAPIAEPLDGPWADGVRRIAASAGVTVIAGMFVPADDGRVTNTLIASGPDVDAHYDKIYLYDAFGFTESRTVAPGHEPVVITVDGVGVGLSLCYDIRFPELYVELARARRATHHRARLVGHRARQARAVDAAGPCPGAGHHQLRRRGRSGLPGRRDRRGRADGSGRQRGGVPLGEVVATAGADPAAAVTDVDLDAVEPVRDTIAVLRNRTGFARSAIGQNRGGD